MHFISGSGNLRSQQPAFAESIRPFADFMIVIEVAVCIWLVHDLLDLFWSVIKHIDDTIVVERNVALEHKDSASLRIGCPRELDEAMRPYIFTIVVVLGQVEKCIDSLDYREATAFWRGANNSQCLNFHISPIPTMVLGMLLQTVIDSLGNTSRCDRFGHQVGHVRRALTTVESIDVSAENEITLNLEIDAHASDCMVVRKVSQVSEDYTWCLEQV